MHVVAYQRESGERRKTLTLDCNVMQKGSSLSWCGTNHLPTSMCLHTTYFGCCLERQNVAIGWDGAYLTNSSAGILRPGRPPAVYDSCNFREICACRGVVCIGEKTLMCMLTSCRQITLLFPTSSCSISVVLNKWHKPVKACSAAKSNNPPPLNIFKLQAA